MQIVVQFKLCVDFFLSDRLQYVFILHIHFFNLPAAPPPAELPRPPPPRPRGKACAN